MKKVLSLILVVVLACVVMTGCFSKAPVDNSTSQPTSVNNEQTSAPVDTNKVINVASLKGPTTMGLLNLIDNFNNQKSQNKYNFTMHGTADEIVPNLVKGDVDIAIVPANLASVLYNKPDVDVQVAAINNLGVLYVVENGDTVKSINDLQGKTIYSTGKGTTPEFVLNYILTQADIDCTIEYKSEATEIAAIMQQADENVIAVLPQPYVTSVQMQNQDVKIALDLTAEWDKVANDSTLVTGVVVVTKEFAEQNKALLDVFLDEYKASCEAALTDVPKTAQLCVDLEIVAKQPIAEKAIPYCNIKYIDGDEMKNYVSGYLEVLYNANPASVGGNLPKDDFYYSK